MLSDEMRMREYWQLLAPGLHIEEKSILQNVAHLQFTNSEQVEMANLLKEDGYIQSSVDWGLDLELMVNTVRSLSGANLLPVFAFLYDEFWYPFLKLHLLYTALLGGKYFLLPAFWVWNVDPKRNESGWKPHRDRGRESLFDDGAPKSLTTWIPLSSATPLNGCMYIVPACHDPIYATTEELNWKLRLGFSSIRALPAKPGDFIIWNQEVLHWGGRTSSRATESRVSIAFELQRADVPAFSEPLLDPFDIPPFETRLKLVAKQLLQYQHMYTLEKELARFASALLAN
jgi:Phytanoyl-CoA dioxygenase (PhyH)